MFSSFSASSYCIHPHSHVREVPQNHLSPNPCTCGACECPIAGKTLNCSACNSDLHPFCKSSSPCLSSALHPVPDHPLTRLGRDMTHALTRRCAVCGEDIKGVSYTCSPCNFDVHPQCSQLPRAIPHGPEAHHVLVLQVREVLNENCHVCGGQCGRWVYRCGVCNVYVHFSCLLKRAGDETSRGLNRHFGYPQHGQGQRYGGPPPHSTGGETSRGLNRHFGYPQHGQGQRYGGPPPHYYGGLQQGYQWGGNYNYHPNHQHYNNNYDYHPNHQPDAGGFIGIMGSIAGSLAVNLFCDVFSSLIQQDLFFS